MKAIVLSTKGGVGKTTFTIQILAPYLNQKTKQKVPFFIGDTVNEDARVFNSDLFEISNSKFYLDKSNDNFIQELALQKDCIVDVGGNQSSELFLKELEDKSFLIDDDFVFFVPTMNEINSINNAIDTYKKLVQISNNFKIIFVLSNVVDTENYEDEFFALFGDTKQICGGIKGKFDTSNIPTDNRKCVVIPSAVSIISLANSYGKPIFELANFKDKAIQEYEELRKTFKDKSVEEAIKAGAKVFNKAQFLKRCDKYKQEQIIGFVFKQFEKLGL